MAKTDSLLAAAKLALSIGQTGRALKTSQDIGGTLELMEAARDARLAISGICLDERR